MSKKQYNKNAMFSKQSGVRAYHIDDQKLNEMKMSYNETGIFPIPYRQGGIYHATIQSLINLGPNKWHSFICLKQQIMKVMKSNFISENETSWDKFCNKISFNGKTKAQWDINTRIQSTIKIMQRLGGLNPYGYKLRQLNACIDLSVSTDAIIKKPNVRLNTLFDNFQSVSPLKTPHKGKGRRKNKVQKQP